MSSLMVELSSSGRYLLQAQHQLGQEPRVLVIDAELAVARRDVTEAVVDSERVVVLQHADAVVGRSRPRLDRGTRRR